MIAGILLRLVFAGALIALATPGARADGDTVPVAAATPADSSDAEHSQDRKSGRSIGLIPAIFSTPETGFGGGAALIVTYRSPEGDASDRPQSLAFFGIVTAKGQASVAFTPELYFRQETWRIEGNLNYAKFPTTFFGVGNDTADDMEEDFTLEGAEAEILILRAIRGDLRLGIRGGLVGRSIQSIDPGGLLDRGLLSGHDGGFYAGLGPVVDWDRRDNTFSPTRGDWLRFEARFYASHFGSDADYRVYLANLRHYESLGRSIVLAGQVILGSRDGDVPFHRLARLGDVMRGIFEGRVIDRTLLAGQAELRFPIRGRFGGVAFGAVGDVADGLDRYRVSEVKFAGGTGLRFSIDPKERINIRFDIGFSKFGSEVYFQFSEAF